MKIFGKFSRFSPKILKKIPDRNLSNPRKTTVETKTRQKKTKTKTQKTKKTKTKTKQKNKKKNKKQKTNKKRGGGERNTTQPIYLVNRVEIIHIVDLMS